MAEEEEDLPPPDLHMRPHAYWKPRPRVASEQHKTLWGTASILMHRAGLNLLGAEEHRPPPRRMARGDRGSGPETLSAAQGAGVRVRVHRSRRLALGRRGGEAGESGGGLARGGTAPRLSLLAGRGGERPCGRPRRGRPCRGAPPRGLSEHRRPAGGRAVPVPGRDRPLGRKVDLCQRLRAADRRFRLPGPGRFGLRTPGRPARCGRRCGRWPATGSSPP